MPLTGRYTFRRTLTGKLVLMIEENVNGHWLSLRGGRTRRRWRDARVSDLTDADVRLTRAELRTRDIVSGLGIASERV